MTPAINAARKSKIEFEVHRYDHDPRSQSYGLEAAQALKLDPAVVFKTLMTELEGGQLAVAIVPVALKLDLKALAAAGGTKKAAMADPARAAKATGYVMGGISPLGQKRQHPTFVDESALGLERIFVSAGRRGLEISLAPADLISLCHATSAAIAR
jgi:Cys-tRNA(Pro)/Cys-tRNA(Cys) deacylase